MRDILKLDDEYELHRFTKTNEPTKLVMSFVSCSFKNTGLAADIGVDHIVFESDNYEYSSKTGIIKPVISKAWIKYNSKQLQEFDKKFKSYYFQIVFDNAQEIFNFLSQDNKII